MFRREFQIRAVCSRARPAKSRSKTASACVSFPFRSSVVLPAGEKCSSVCGKLESATTKSSPTPIRITFGQSRGLTRMISTRHRWSAVRMRSHFARGLRKKSKKKAELERTRFIDCRRIANGVVQSALPMLKTPSLGQWAIIARLRFILGALIGRLRAEQGITAKRSKASTTATNGQRRLGNSSRATRGSTILAATFGNGFRIG